MKLILTQEVTGLGEPGDVVDVKDGYGRNFLLPRRRPPLDQGRRGAGRRRSAVPARPARSPRSRRRSRSAPPSSRSGHLTARAGQSGRLFGAVTPGDIAEALVASVRRRSTAARSSSPSRSSRWAATPSACACTATSPRHRRDVVAMTGNRSTEPPRAVPVRRGRPRASGAARRTSPARRSSSPRVAAAASSSNETAADHPAAGKRRTDEPGRWSPCGGRRTRRSRQQRAASTSWGRGPATARKRPSPAPIRTPSRTKT